MSVPIRPVRGAHDVARVRDLFREYVGALGIDLSSQGFDAELASLPGRYASPRGALFLASRPDGAWRPDGEAIGCVGVRPLDRAGTCEDTCEDTCEIKRLYVRDAGRGSGAGRALAHEAIAFAASAGYREVVLDTLPGMTAAIALYRDLGFVEVPPYWESALPGTIYLGRRLR